MTKRNIGPRPMAARTLHPTLHRIFQSFPNGGSVLDLGAGQGALSLWLMQNGFEVTACDIRPEAFKVPDVPCVYADASQPLPFAEGRFRFVACIELIEHIEDQFSLLRECHRVLAPGGVLVLSTPNVMSLMARLLYFWTSFYPLFNRPMNETEEAPAADHIHPIAYPQLRYILHTNGFQIERIHADKHRYSNVALLPCVPCIALGTWLRLRHERDPRQRRRNSEVFSHLLSLNLLLGRIMIVVSRKIPA